MAELLYGSHFGVGTIPQIHNLDAQVTFDVKNKIKDKGWRIEFI